MADILLSSIESSSVGGGLIMPARSIDEDFITIRLNDSSTDTSFGGSFYLALEANFSLSSKKFDCTTFISPGGTSEQTVVDLSGQSGVLTNVLTPRGIALNGTHTIKITIDGEEFTYSIFSANQQHKGLLGYADFESPSKGFENTADIPTRIITPEEVLQKGGFGMVFRDSLKVTIQNDIGYPVGSLNDKACVFYTTYIPEGLK